MVAILSSCTLRGTLVTLPIVFLIFTCESCEVLIRIIAIIKGGCVQDSAHVLLLSPLFGPRNSLTLTAGYVVNRRPAIFYHLGV